MRNQALIDELAQDIKLHAKNGTEMSMLRIIAEILLRILAEIMETNNK